MTGSPAVVSEGALSRSLGVRELAASIITITIGGGVFLLPAAAAKGLGAAAWLAYVVCAAVFVLIVICFAEAGSRVQGSGGPYAYVGAAFGPFWGFIAGVLGLIFATLAHAAVAAGFTQAANAIVPGIGVGATRTVVLVVVFVFFTAINLRGVKQGARLVEIGTVAKLVPLVFFGIVGLFAVKGANVAWPGMPPVGDLARTSMMLMFAFFGLETALLPSGEVRDPARTVPRAIFIAIGFITLLYLAVQQSAQGILGPELVNFEDAPLAAAAERGFGRAAGMLLMAGAAISMLMHTPGMLLAMPRSVYALAKDGFLPSFLARIHPTTHVPANAIVAYSAVAGTMAITGTFTSLLILANIGALLMYALACLSVLGLRRSKVRLEANPFRVPGGAVVPWLATAALVVLLSTVTFAEFRAMGIALAGAAVLYVVRRPRTPGGAPR